MPSEIMGIEDDYTAFCFNEACALIVSKLKEGEEPVINKEKNKVYSKPSDFYKRFDK